MRVLGILGGMSWVSTLEYYRGLNERIAVARGKQHSARIVLASVDFQEIVDFQVRGDWAAAGELLAEQARGLERAGADGFLIASNTMHKVLAPVAAAVAMPALDIFDATAAALHAAGVRRAGLLGTRYTMSDGFFVGEYARRGIEVVVPQKDAARRVNEIIFRELIHGEVRVESAAFYREAVESLARDAGAQGVIMGCTEIGLLLRVGEGAVPLFDTAALHIEAAAHWLLSPNDGAMQS